MDTPLRFIPLGGTGEVNKNMYLYHWGEHILIVDCGLGFPGPFNAFLGVDRVLPDFSYLRDKKEQIRGVLITHGHEDHFGALPFFLSQFSAPVYLTKLVAGFLKKSLLEKGVKGARLVVFDPDKDCLSLGPFEIYPFRVTHSVPDSVGFVIKTPVGRFVHIGDFKFDWTPVAQPPFALGRLLKKGRGALVLLSDCLGVNNEGYTQSERIIGDTFRFLLSRAENQVIITTISSNISRIQQAVEVARECGRRVVFVGRSIRQKVKIAQNLGYLKLPSRSLLSLEEAKRWDQRKIVYVIAGSYGQEDSALFKVAWNLHPSLKLEKRALVLFSADPAPPGTKILVDALVDRLLAKGAEVHYYDLQENLHVSGHASRGDLALLVNLIRPRFFLPLGGTLRHMKSYRDLIAEMGYDPKKVLLLPQGQVVEFLEGEVRWAKKIRLEDVFLRGRIQMGRDLLSLKKKIVHGGVLLAFPNPPRLISLGFLPPRDPLLREGKREMERILQQRGRNFSNLKDKLESFFQERVGFQPEVVIIHSKVDALEKGEKRW